MALLKTNTGIGTTNPTSALHVIGDGLFTGVVTVTTFNGDINSNTSSLGNASASQLNVSGVSTFIGAITGTISTATKLETARTFEITGDVVASPITFDGTGNVSLAATIQPNSVELGTDTFGDYVESISGTTNEIDVTGGTGEGSTPVISFAPNPLIGGNVTIGNDLQVNNNLNVTGNITVGGTAGYILVNEFRVTDADIVLGFTTDISGNDVSNDTTANHGGIAVASTEGNPLVTLTNPGVGETLPATYKKIMWFKAGSFAGLNTDAWLSNYAIGIGSTQFPSGTRLAAGSVQFTENDLAVVRNINASGIVTAPTFVGNLTGTASTASFATTAFTLNGVAEESLRVAFAQTAGISTNVIGGIASVTQLSVSGVTTLSSVGASQLNVSGVTTSVGGFVGNLTGTATTATNLSDAANITTGTINAARLTGTYNIDISGNAATADYADVAGIATYATNAGVATYADTAGIATNVIGGIASVTQLSVSGVSTLGVVTAGNIFSTGIVTALTFVGNLTGTASTASFATTAFSLNGTAEGDLNVAFAQVAGIATFATNAGIATNLKGGVAGNVPYQSAPDTTTFVTNGSSGQVLLFNGSIPIWSNVSAASGAFGGITVYDEGNLVGTAGSIASLDFVGSNLTVTGTSGANGIATVTMSDNLVGTALSISGISTFSDNVTVGSGITMYASTGIISATAFYGSGQNLTDLINQRIEGLQIQNEGSDVGVGFSFATLNFVGNYVTATGVGTVANITFTTPPYADVAGISTYASTAGVATALQNSRDFSVSGDVSTSSAVSFDGTGNVDLAVTLSNTFSANTSGIITSSGGFVGNLTGTATTATNLADAANITTGTIDSARLTGTYNIDISGNAATATYADVAGIATYASTAGVATYAGVSGFSTFSGYANIAGIATYASTAGVATYATTAGIATNATTAGTATTATNINISATSSGDTTAYVVLVGDNTTGGQQPFIDNGSLTYNASTNVLTAGGGFSGDGSALTSLNGSQITSGTIPGDRGVTSGSTSSSFIEYNGITATSGQFDGGTTTPSGTTRLNYGGYLYATRFYGDGSQLTGTGGVSISTNTTNQAQYLTYAISTGSTTGLGVTTSGLVFNPSSTSLGIGTTNPEAKLDVRGALNIGKFGGNGVYGSNSSVTITSQTDQYNNVVYFNPVDASGTPATGNRLSVGINTTLNYGLGAGNGSADLFFAGEDNIITGSYFPKIKIGNPNYANSDFYSLQAVYSGSGVGAYPSYGYIRNALYDATYSVALNGSFAFSVGERSSLDGNRASNFTSGNEAFVVVLNGSTSLFHNKSKKFETTGYGVTITGELNVSGVVTATSFTGNLTGTATTATNVTVTTSTTNSAFKVPFANTTANTTGNYGLLQDSTATFTYNPSTDTLTVGTFSGSGASLTSLNASNISSGTIPGDRGVTAGSASPSFVEYNGTTATSGQFDGGSTTPSGTTRLNYGGYLYATRFYGDGSNLSALSASNISSGTLAIARGGTNSTATPTNGGVSYGTGSAFAFTSAGTSGQILQSAGAAAPVWSSNLNLSGVVTATAYYGDGSNLTGVSAAGYQFNVGITSIISTQLTGLGSNLLTLPSTAGKRYIIHSINASNVAAGNTDVNVIGAFDISGGERSYFAYNIPIPTGTSVELLRQPQVLNPSDVIVMRGTDYDRNGSDDVVQVYISYEVKDDINYFGVGVGTVGIAVTDPTTIYTSTSNPSVIQSIRLVNRTDTGGYPVSVTITSGVTTTYLIDDLIVPKYGSVEILDTPKALSTNDTIQVIVDQTETIDVQVSGIKVV